MRKIEQPEEVTTVNSINPFGQGDVLRLPDRMEPPHFGIIINADCDLENNKTDGVIAFLPLYSLQEYIELFWLPEFVDNQRNIIINEILNIIGGPVTDRAATVRWLESQDYEGFVETNSNYFSFSGKDRKNLLDQVERYLAIFRPRKSPLEEFKELCKLNTNPSKYAQKQINGAYQQIGDGHIVINEIPGVSGLGFVVRMRRIYSIEQEKCFQSEHNMRLSSKKNHDCLFRIAKLTPVFQFKFSQVFAYQFSRIGLPNELREMHQLVVSDMAEKIAGDL